MRNMMFRESSGGYEIPICEVNFRKSQGGVRRSIADQDCITERGDRAGLIAYLECGFAGEVASIRIVGPEL